MNCVQILSFLTDKMQSINFLSEKNRKKAQKDLAARRRDGDEISVLEMTQVFNDGDGGQFTPEQR